MKVTDRNKTCQTCHKQFYCTSASGSKRWNERKFCSRKCHSKSKKGKIFFDKTGLKHSEETKRKMSLASMGKSKSLIHRQHMSQAFLGLRMEEKNPAWKGNNVSYDGLHRWIRKRLKKPLYCEQCNKIKKLQLANKSHEYTRNLADWLWLCSSCHALYDNIGKKVWITRRQKYGQNGLK